MKSDISADSAAPGDFFADAPPLLRLIDSVRARIRVKHYSWRTEDTYVDWIKRYLRFHDKRHLRELSVAHVERFPGYLASERRRPRLSGRQTVFH